jgi:methyl-accepting chemotaxis protein
MSASMQESLASTSEITTASGELSAMASTLDELVGAFNV